MHRSANHELQSLLIVVISSRTVESVRVILHSGTEEFVDWVDENVSGPSQVGDQ